MTKQTRDGGKDIIVTNFGDLPEMLYVDCKLYKASHLVNITTMREFHSVLTLDEIPRGIIATSSNFTRDAKLLAERMRQANCHINLKDNAGVFHWIDLYLDHANHDGSIYMTPPILKLF